MCKSRVAALVFGITLSLVSGRLQADSSGNLFFSGGFSGGIFNNRSLELQHDFWLMGLNTIKLGIAWELPAGPGNAAFGLAA